jgi:hypothetical protein
MVSEVGCFSNYTFDIVGATGNINDMGNVMPLQCNLQKRRTLDTEATDTFLLSA